MAKNEVSTVVLDVKVNYEDAIKKIADYRTRLDKVKETEAELKKQLKEGAIKRKEYNQAISETKIEAAEYNEAIRVITKQVRNQIKVEKEQEGSLKSLRAELSNLTAEYDAMSRAERESASGKAFGDKIKELSEEIKKAEEATGRYYRNVGNYEESIKEALGLNNSFADSLLNLSENGKGASGVISGITSNIKAFWTALSGFITNPVFLALAGIAGAGVAFKWWYDYNKGLVEATRLTKQFTNLSGDELKSYRNEVQVLADTYGKDFTEVLRSVNALSKQFGIDQQDALNLVRDGFIAGADANGEYLDILKEYPAYFKEAGISAEGFVAITTQAAQEGIFSDKAVDAIKEANTRLREMTDTTAQALDGIGISSKKVQKDLQSGATTTFEVMQQVSEKLNELPESSSAVGTAIADIFGGPGEDAGLQYIKTLKGIDTNLDEVKANAGELGELQEQLLDSELKMQNALSGLADQTGGNFEAMTTKAKIFLSEGLTSIINGVKDIIDWMKDLYDNSMFVRTAIQGIGFQFKTVFNIVSTLIKSLIAQFQLLGGIIKSIFTLDWDTFENAFIKYGDSMKNNIKGLVNDISDNIKDANKEIAGDIKELSDDAIKQTETNTSTTDTGTNEDTETPNNLQSAVEAKKKELAEIRKAEDEMLKLIRDERARQTQEIELQYARQIEDLRNRLVTEEGLTKKAQSAIRAQITIAEKQKQAALQKLSEEALQQELTNREKLISLQLESAKEGSQQEYELKVQQLATQRELELSNKELTEEMKAAIIAKYQKQELDLSASYEKKASQRQQDAMKLHFENELMELEQKGASELEMLKVQEEQKKQLRDSIRQEDYTSEEEYQNAKLTANQSYLEAKQALADKEIEIEQTKVMAISGFLGTLSDAIEAAGENNKGMAQLAKVLAIAEIAIAQGVAIAKAVETATKSSATWIDMLAAIGTVVASVTAVMATATKSVKSAKFAEGGLVSGPGSGTSDSIPARLSNGESVVTARATEMFAPILSSFNMMGGGVPINVTSSSNQAIGEDMLARAVAKGMMMAPPPQVSVEEFTSVANKVKVLEQNGSI